MHLRTTRSSDATSRDTTRVQCITSVNSQQLLVSCQLFMLSAYLWAKLSELIGLYSVLFIAHVLALVANGLRI
jgi:hypothetical protein